MMHFTTYALELASRLASGDAEERAAAAAQVQALLAAYREAGKDVVVELFGERRAEALLSADRAQSNLSGLVIGITISAIIAVAVAIPVINDVVADSNATGTTKTILDLLDLFVGLLILVAIAAPLMRRTS